MSASAQSVGLHAAITQHSIIAYLGCTYELVGSVQLISAKMERCRQPAACSSANGVDVYGQTRLGEGSVLQ